MDYLDHRLFIGHDLKRARAVAIVLVFTVTFLTLSAHTATAATVPTQVIFYDLPTYSAVNQTRQILIRMSPDPPPGYNYIGCQVSITVPDGTTELLNSASNATGFISFSYAPSVIGNYNIDYFIFSGQTITDDVYTALDASISQTWVVAELPDVDPPTGSVVINDGALSTNTVSVSLTLSADDVSKVSFVRFSNDGSSWSDWEPYTFFTLIPVSKSYNTQKAWSLTPGNGLKTVYVQFIDEAGLVSVSYYDTITLSAPLGSSSLSCSLSSTTLTVGGNVEITGYLSLAQSGESILVQGRANGSTWLTLATVSTASDGEYYFVWSPTVDGTWEIKAIWGGDINTLPCESTIQTLTVSGPDITTILIIVGSIAAIGVVGGGIYILTRSKLRPAQHILTKIVEGLSHRNYGNLLNDFDRLVNLISKAVLSGKLPSEILADPYCTVENLTIIKEILAEGLATNTMEILVGDTEIIAYVDGVKRILKAFESLKDWKKVASSKQPEQEIAKRVDHIVAPIVGTRRKRGESSAEFLVALISDNPMVKAFYRNVIGQRQPLVGDFWFSWMKPRAKEAEEYEPVRLKFEDGKIVGARSRVHWRHLEAKAPYLDERKRAEVFFLPLFHTPIVRERVRVKNLHMVLLYHVFVGCFGARVEDYQVVEGTIPPYYTERGDKPSHRPPVYYQGWHT